MNRALIAALALTLAAHASLAAAAPTRAQPASLADRALCAVGATSHCPDNAANTIPVVIAPQGINNPIIINRRLVCPATRCQDNATSNNPIIINR